MALLAVLALSAVLGVFSSAGGLLTLAPLLLLMLPLLAGLDPAAPAVELLMGILDALSATGRSGCAPLVPAGTPLVPVGYAGERTIGSRGPPAPTF